MFFLISECEMLVLAVPNYRWRTYMHVPVLSAKPLNLVRFKSHLTGVLDKTPPFCFYIEHCFIGKVCICIICISIYIYTYIYILYIYIYIYDNIYVSSMIISMFPVSICFSFYLSIASRESIQYTMSTEYYNLDFCYFP